MIQILHAIIRGESIEKAIGMMSDKDKETMRSLLPFVQNLAKRTSKDAAERYDKLKIALDSPHENPKTKTE